MKIEKYLTENNYTKFVYQIGLKSNINTCASCSYLKKIHNSIAGKCYCPRVIDAMFKYNQNVDVDTDVYFNTDEFSVCKYYR